MLRPGSLDVAGRVGLADLVDQAGRTDHPVASAAVDFVDVPNPAAVHQDIEARPAEHLGQAEMASQLASIPYEGRQIGHHSYRSPWVSRTTQPPAQRTNDP